MEPLQSPDYEELELRAISLKIDRALAAEFRRRGVHSSIAGNFKKMFQEIDVDGSNRITYKELDEAVRIRLGLGEELISRNELQGLWRYVDADQSGELSPDEFQSALYLFKISAWPDYSHVEYQPELAHTLTMMNAAADKWHKAGGNWFKIFRRMDTDESGQMGYEEIEAVIRTTFPGLKLSLNEISEENLHGLWKALDVDRSGLISVQEFMIFMRRHAKHHEVLAYGGVPAARKKIEQAMMLSKLRDRPSSVPRTPTIGFRGSTASGTTRRSVGFPASPVRPMTSQGLGSPNRSTTAASINTAGSFMNSWSAPTITSNAFVKPTATEVCSNCVCAATVRCGSCRAFYCQDCCDIVHVGPRAEAKHMKLRSHVIRPIAREICKRCTGPKTDPKDAATATMFCWDCDTLACSKCDLIVHNQLRLCGHRRCPIINRRRPMDSNSKAKFLSKNHTTDVPYRYTIDNVA